MGVYVYRLSKRGDAITAKLGDRTVQIGVYEYAFKPYRTWDGESTNRKWRRQAQFAVDASWRNLPRPDYCVLAYRDRKTGEITIDNNSCVMKYISDLVYDDVYDGSPRYMVGTLHKVDGEWIVLSEA